MSFRLFFTFLFITGCSFMSFAMHTVEGEISYKKVYPNNPANTDYEITVFTKSNSSELTEGFYIYVLFGDEITGAPLDSIARVDVTTDADIQYNTYRTVHTYPQNGEYLIQVEAGNRAEGVINITESVEHTFFIEAMLRISDSSETTNENSVKSLSQAVSVACIDDTWTYNMAAFDADGDSLVYELVPCRGEGGVEINSWSLPDQIPGFSYNGDVYSYTDGTMFWEIPLFVGEYNMALKISEFSQGVLVGYVIKDFTVEVEECTDGVSFSEAIQDITVYPWTEVEFDLVIDGFSAESNISVVGGVLTEIENAATFEVVGQSELVTGRFNWIPNYGNVRDQPYVLVFQAHLVDGITSTDTEIIQITVLDPGENSVEELETTEISVFPNPASSNISLVSPSLIGQKYSVFNMLGVLLLSGEVTTHNQQVDISALPASMYLINVGVNQQRILKVNE